MTRSELEQLYNKFWLNYTKILDNIPISYYPTRGSVFNVRQNPNNELVISLEVDFKRLRFKSSSKKGKNLALQIRGVKKCSFSKNNQSKVTHSNVAIYYFKNEETLNGGSLTFFESLHYDYEINNDSLKNHPIYHCQFGDYKRESFFGRDKYDVDISKAYSHHHQVRIPTANMDMISVLLSIAADHLSPEDFDKVLKVYDEGNWHNRFPHISHHTKPFSPNECYRSRAWYIGQ